MTEISFPGRHRPAALGCLSHHRDVDGSHARGGAALLATFAAWQPGLAVR
jgi:hypothetical protein